MTCTTCGQAIKHEYFVALIGGNRYYFHINHRPMFYYQRKEPS